MNCVRDQVASAMVDRFNILSANMGWGVRPLDNQEFLLCMGGAVSYFMEVPTYTRCVEIVRFLLAHFQIYVGNPTMMSVLEFWGAHDWIIRDGIGLINPERLLHLYPEFQSFKPHWGVYDHAPSMLLHEHDEIREFGHSDLMIHAAGDICVYSIETALQTWREHDFRIMVRIPMSERFRLRDTLELGECVRFEPRISGSLIVQGGWICPAQMFTTDSQYLYIEIDNGSEEELEDIGGALISSEVCPTAWQLPLESWAVTISGHMGWIHSALVSFIDTNPDLREVIEASSVWAEIVSRSEIVPMFTRWRTKGAI